MERTIWYMNKDVLYHFSSDELHALGLVHFLNSKPLYALADLFSQTNTGPCSLRHNIWGPSARTRIELERGTKGVYYLRSAARSAASAFIPSLKYLTSLLNILDLTKDLHTLFAVRPQHLRQRRRERTDPDELGHLTDLLRVLSDLEDDDQYKFGKIMHSDTSLTL